MEQKQISEGVFVEQPQQSPEQSVPDKGISFAMLAPDVETQITNYTLTQLFKYRLGSLADIAAGLATHQLYSAISGLLVDGDGILILKSYSGAENLVITKRLHIFGQGYDSVIGSLTFSNIAAPSGSLVKYLRLTGNLVFAAANNDINVTDCWQTEAATVTEAGSDNFYDLIGV